MNDICDEYTGVNMYGMGAGVYTEIAGVDISSMLSTYTAMLRTPVSGDDDE